MCVVLSNARVLSEVGLGEASAQLEDEHDTRSCWNRGTGLATRARQMASKKPKKRLLTNWLIYGCLLILVLMLTGFITSGKISPGFFHFLEIGAPLGWKIQ